MQPSEVIVFLIAANVIVVMGAIFFFLIIRIQQKRKQVYKQQLLEQEYKSKEEALLQISRDLHDDIGSSLSGINMLSQLAREEIIQNNNASATDILQKINGYTTEVIDKVSDMAWLLKPNQESLSMLIKKLNTYNVASASSKNIVLHFENNKSVLEKELTIPQRKAIYLVSKEAINNAIKYSSCKNIFHSIQNVDNKIKLQIKDDGNGFSLSEINSGNGLANMKARAEEIKADFDIISEQGKGTTIKLAF